MDGRQRRSCPPRHRSAAFSARGLRTRLRPCLACGGQRSRRIRCRVDGHAVEIPSEVHLQIAEATAALVGSRSTASLNAEDQLSDWRPQRRHLYLATVGTSPTMQRRGLAERAITPMLTTADNEGSLHSWRHRPRRTLPSIASSASSLSTIVSSPAVARTYGPCCANQCDRRSPGAQNAQHRTTRCRPEGRGTDRSIWLLMKPTRSDDMRTS